MIREICCLGTHGQNKFFIIRRKAYFLNSREEESAFVSAPRQHLFAYNLSVNPWDARIYVGYNIFL